MAYTADLYDTPSGHLNGDYVLATGSSTFDSTHHIAHRIGTQSWTVCKNSNGQTFEFKMASGDYDNVAHHGASIGNKDVLLSALP